jgi:hypothetical protein
MSEIKILLVSLGYMPHFINFDAVKNWNSKIFRVIGYDRIELLPNAEGSSWYYPDDLLEEKVPTTREADFTLAVVNLPLKQNYFARRIHDNRVVITTYEAVDILEASDISLENYIVRMLYKYSIVFKRYSRIPPLGEGILSHDETRACLFDMTLVKTDIVYSTERLALCEECRLNLKKSGVPVTFLSSLENDLKKVKKSTYYRILGFIKKRPIVAIAISLLSAMFMNIISSLIYDILFGS